MTDSSINRIHHRIRRWAKVSEAQGVTILVETHGFNVNGGKRLIDSPWVAEPGTWRTEVIIGEELS